MTKHRVIPAAILVVLLAGVLTPQFAQDSASPDKSDQEKMRRALLIGLLRTINTAEVTDLSTYRSYSSWHSLRDHNQEHFDGWLANFTPEARMQFADTPEVLPGISLRLNVHADGQGYDVRLQDTAETKFVFAAFSDESGVIWRAEPLQ